MADESPVAPEPTAPESHSLPSELEFAANREPAPVIGVPTGIAMKQRHPVTVWLLWPLLTVGIYHLVWYYKIHKEMAQFDRRRIVPVVGPMLVLLFLSWTFVAPMISYYNCGVRIRNAQRAAGIGSCSAGLGTVLMLLFGAGTMYYQIELNKISESYAAPEGQQVALRA